MYNRFDNIIRFKNGNMHMKIDNDVIENIKNNGINSFYELLFNNLSDFDTYIIETDISLGNNYTGIRLYSAYSEKVFLINVDECYNTLISGKTYIFQAYKPYSYEMNLISDFYAAE